MSNTKGSGDRWKSWWDASLTELLRSPVFPPWDRLRIWRHANSAGRLTIGEAAALVGASPTTWGNWEKGLHSPRGAMSETLERLTGIPSADWT